MKATQPNPSSRWRIRSTGVVLIAVICTLASACDPCSGVSACARPNDRPYLAMDGQIVDPVSGVGIDGVRVDVVRRAGVDVAQNAMSTVTAAGGHWRAEFEATSSGFVDVDVTITTPAGFSYTATGVRVTTSATGGEATVLDRWVNRLYFPNAGELYVRGTHETRVAGAGVEFRRTSGVELVESGVTVGVIRSATDFAGRVPLFSIDDDDVYTNSLGSVTGDVIVRRSATDSSVIRNVRIGSSYVYRAPTGIIRLGIGPSLAYYAKFVSRATGIRVGGVAVSFERVSGVALAVPVFSTVADTTGRFDFDLNALAVGAVQGRLIYRAPQATVAETLLVTLPTFDSDSILFYGAIGVGPPKP